MSHCCAHCKKAAATSRCSACLLPFYCNKLCQSSHWKSIHKKQCKLFRENGKPQYTLDVFLKSVETGYVTMDEASPQTKKEENKIFNKHNETIQSLLYFAKKIERSDTLSLNEKLSQTQKIADNITKYDDLISQNLDNIPLELFTNNDDSLLIESSLKNYCPSKDIINRIISDLYSQRLKVDDPMNVMYYTMTTDITQNTLQSVVNALNFALNNLDLKSSIFGINNVGKNKKSELAEIDIIVNYINDDVFKQIKFPDTDRPDGCSDLVRFDNAYKLREDCQLLMNGYIRKIDIRNIAPSEIICLCQEYCGTARNDAIYSGKLTVSTEYGEDDYMMGFHYGATWNMDCAGDLFAFSGCVGYKGRDCGIEEFWIDPSNKDYEMKSIRSWRGLSSPSNMVFCDDIHDTIWVAGDHRIKCSGFIENGKDTNYEEYELSCDYILSHQSIKGSKTLFVTEQKAFVYSDNGTFYVWDLNKLNDHCTDYCTESCDDDSIPKVDEYGIETQCYSIVDAGNCEGDQTYEVSGGQSHMDSFQVDTKYINNIKINQSELSICDNMNKFDGLLFITNNNVIYKYNIEKNIICGSLLGHNTGSVHFPFRQYLLNNNNLIISHDYGLVKVWDIRINEAIISIKASGNYKLMTAIGFGFDESGNNNYVASGGGDEAVTVWDLRYSNDSNALYEISAGNNMINKIIWHKPSASLIAASDTNIYNDYWGNGRSDHEENKWPKDAVHQIDDFQKQFDLNYNDVLRYKFLI